MIVRVFQMRINTHLAQLQAEFDVGLIAKKALFAHNACLPNRPNPIFRPFLPEPISAALVIS
jgi:hypothetical protein